jgi:hypothetical protein
MMKTEIPGIYKEEDGILVNKDNAALARYKERKMKMQKMDSVGQRLDKLEDDINTIKQLLLKMVNN